MASYRKFILRLVGALLIAAHLVLFSALPFGWRTLAALCITGLIPGILLVEWALHQYGLLFDRLERALLAIGAGYTILICTTLFASYVPGGLGQGWLLALFDGLTVLLVGLGWRQGAVFEMTPGIADKIEQNGAQRWLVAGLLCLLLVGGYFRLADLDYSEFQSDEALPALRAAGVVQGAEETLFLHKKGATEILIPAALLALTGQLTEQSGRLPFALANLASIFVVFGLGRRLFGAQAGWIAALLLAVDGYYIGYAHMMQYQSIIFLMTPLVVLILYRLVQAQADGSPTDQPGSLSRGLLLAALFVATGLLSHYDGIIVLLPSAYLLWLLARRGVGLKRLGWALVIPALVAAGLVASFYLPFVLHPNFQATYAYYSNNVIGNNQLLYNHLAEFVGRATLFNTVYVFWLTVVVTLLALIRLYQGNIRGRGGQAAGGLVILLGTIVIFAPQWLRIGGIDFTPFLVGVVGLGLFVLPKTYTQERLLWLWFGVLLLQSLFLTKEPSAHFHVFLVPWFLIVGQTLAWLWQKLRTAVGEWPAATVGVGLTVGCLLLFGSYAHWFFMDHVEAVRHWQTITPPRWWPVQRSVADQPIFGVPHQSGWKTIGVLYATGQLRGAYNTNMREWAPAWYTRGAEFCEEEPVYILIERLERPAEQAELRAKLADAYHLFGTVEVGAEPRLEIYQRDPVTSVQRFDAAVYAPQFDANLTGADLPLRAPVVEPQLIALDYHFGDAIQLVGYRLEQTAVQPGETLALTLHWRATKSITQQYTLFNQVIGAQDKMLGQLDTAPSCEAGPTNEWETDALISGYYQIPIFTDAMPGEYPLIVGLYQSENGERLPITTAAGEAIGTQIQLATISITP